MFCFRIGTRHLLEVKKKFKPRPQNKILVPLSDEYPRSLAWDPTSLIPTQGKLPGNEVDYSQ